MASGERESDAFATLLGFVLVAGGSVVLIALIASAGLSWETTVVALVACTVTVTMGSRR